MSVVGITLDLSTYSHILAIGVVYRMNACYNVDKKLSQFDNFQYLWNFDVSWWIFEKHFVTKKFNNDGLHLNISLYYEIVTNMNK
jgi:hypothetical protein